MVQLGSVWPSKAPSPRHGKLSPDLEAPPKPSELRRTQSFKVDDYTVGSMLYLHLTIVVTVLPILFIWSMPALTRWSPGHYRRAPTGEPDLDAFATPGLDPAEPGDVPIGYTLSSYISNAHSTGAIAMFFKGNSLMTWSEYGLKAFLENVARDDENDDRYLFAFLLMFIYELSFGLFLTFSTDYMPVAHLVTTTLFCSSAILAYNYLYKIGLYYRRVHSEVEFGLHPICGWLVYLGSVTFANTITLVLLHVTLNINFGHLFWASECTGLTCVLFVGGLDRFAKFIEKKGWPHTKYILTFGLLGNRVGNDRMVHLMRRASKTFSAFGGSEASGHSVSRTSSHRERVGPTPGGVGKPASGSSGGHRVRWGGLGRLGAGRRGRDAQESESARRRRSGGGSVTFLEDGPPGRSGGGGGGGGAGRLL